MDSSALMLVPFSSPVSQGVRHAPHQPPLQSEYLWLEPLDRRSDCVPGVDECMPGADVTLPGVKRTPRLQ